MRATKRRMQSNSGTSVGGGRNQKQPRGKGPTMFELSSGVSASKAMFAHAHRQTSSGGRSSQDRGKSLPLNARLSKSDPSLSAAGGGGGAHRGGQFSSKHAASLGDERSSSSRKSHTKSHHSEKDGYIREISFIPKGDSKPARRGGRSRDDRGNKKESRTDRERSHFSN